VKTSRRQFIKAGSAAGTAFLLTSRGKLFAQATIGSPPLTKFVDRMPMFTTDIPLASPVKDPVTGADFYRIVMGQYTHRMHRDMPRETRVWGYADMTKSLPRFTYLGAPILAKQNKPVRINFVNLLPNIHPLPVDRTIPGAETGQHVNRAVVHLHGGHVPWVSDGGPFHWSTPIGAHGPSLVKWLPNVLGIPTDDNWYPNDQTSRFMWYHDHAVGITRLNAYAGLATGYVITDVGTQAGGFETDLVGAGLPFPGIIVVLQEKQFKAVADRWGLKGDLWYPSLYPDTPDPSAKYPLPFPSCVPEFFGDTTVINGKVCPYVVVKPQIQRFRFLNGAQSRFYNLRLFEETASSKQADQSKPGPDFTVIGTEGGFLPSPVLVSSSVATGQIQSDTGLVDYHLLLGPAERADLVVDFRGKSGKRYVLYNDAPGPFPSGDPAIDSANGLTPDTANLLEIVVANSADAVAGSDNVTLAPYAAGTLNTNGINPLVKSLNETVDDYGRLIQYLGTNVPLRYLDFPVTEFAAAGDVQVWDVYNTTGDTHPIHFHLFDVQVLGRAPFSTVGEDVSAALVPPDAYELGWKETVRMNPETVTRVAMQFDIPPTPFRIPVSPRIPKVVEGGHLYGFYEYVWHCHILEHEEHDMMRPLAVKVLIK
jgi:spore coat protein A, manganese oxidase